MNKMMIPGIMLAVAVMATGCNRDTDNDGRGPAQEAGKALDDTGAAVGREAREGVENADRAAERAAENIDQATDRAAANAEHAAAEVREETREAAQDAKRGVDNATDAAGRQLERAGERMQDGSK